MASATPTTTGNASTTDLLTALKNVVLALNNATQTYLNVNGLTVTTGINTPTVLKSSAGRVVRVSITTPGSSTGVIYDAAQVGVTTKPLWVIPETAQPNGEPFQVNLPTKLGILVVPGTAMVVAVSSS